ncbi:hypothetical protein D3C80_1857240 [compost metagenome]
MLTLKTLGYRIPEARASRVELLASLRSIQHRKILVNQFLGIQPAEHVHYILIFLGHKFRRHFAVDHSPFIHTANAYSQSGHDSGMSCVISFV